MERTIGILLDPQTYRALPRKETGQEDVGLYDRSARKLGLTLLYFTLGELRRGYVTGRILQNGRYRQVKAAIPPVTHNRTLIGTTAGKRRMRRLQASSTVFNGDNRYSKLYIHRLLAAYKELRPYLPATWPYSAQRLAKAMRSGLTVYLKPLDGTVGRGIVKLTPIPDTGRWKLQWGDNRQELASASAAEAWVRRKICGRSYLIQEAIPLASSEGRPFDLRVAVQRDGTGFWKVTGVLGKRAAAGSHITNIARGGTSLPGETLLRTGVANPAAAMAEVHRVSLAIARRLGQRLPLLADLGLDVGVDRDGRVSFIEMNGRHQRMAFAEAGMREAYERIYEMPLRYAAYVLDRIERHGRQRR
ncbi:YheC/YheD family protein [Paenibacillus athensensis]|nr:YheC/YheD family protein [Paenibacillus athensensis]MCD1257406.1 YheC/YheD family protein [Paenibacillus athensensis]